jgi:hypothetical protein
MIFSSFSPLLRLPMLANLTRDSLLKMDPETAHGATITALRLGLAPQQEGSDPQELKTSIAGLELSNPVGMAAGFDKNGEVPRPDRGCGPQRPPPLPAPQSAAAGFRPAVPPSRSGRSHP